MISKETIQELSEKIAKKILNHRRFLHQYPELSFKEYKTASFIKKTLQEIGIERVETICETGVIAVIKGEENSGNVTALRADIDALPIEEKTNFSFSSRNSGIMHACGHDVHTACLLGASEILFKLKKHIKGSIKIIFQPGEEQLPGGASKIIKANGLENPKVQHIIAQHIFPELIAGKVGFRSGKYMASCDEIFIKVIGKGGHAAIPQNTIDSVLVSSHIITTLQHIVSRCAKPSVPTVLSFGKIYSEGGTTNIIPDVVNIEGTFRTMDEEQRNILHKKIEQTTLNIAKSFGAEIKLQIKKGYPVLKNSEITTKISKNSALEYLGKENVIELPIRMTSEDFSFYTQHVQGCFYRLGTGFRNKPISSLHSSFLEVNEECLKIGAGLMAFIALNQLNYSLEN